MEGVVEAAAAAVTEQPPGHADLDYGCSSSPSWAFAIVAYAAVFREDVHNELQPSLYHRRCHLCIQVTLLRL